LCGLNTSVQQVFDVAGFSKLFTIFPDRASAMRALGQAPAPKPVVSDVAKRAAELIGSGKSSGAPHPQAAELARAAAQLLGVKAAAPKPAPAKPVPVPKVQAPPAPEPPPPPAPGVIGKLRGLFGGKR
ncbi:MAG TPA: hypothetical protein VFB32_08520, partial [Rudaea sp.]|nr:hypothetical protein [Rudaea sp.]